MTKDLYGTTEKILAAHAELKTRRVLEIGCGDGRVTAPLSRLSKALTALDPDPLAIKSVEEAWGHRVSLHCLPAEALPFAENAFDTVVFSQSLHHVGGIQQAFAEAFRVVRPGGDIIVVEPMPDSELMHIYSVFDPDEIERLRRVQDFLGGCGLTRKKHLVFEPVWEFADSAELLEWLKRFREATPGLQSELAERLGSTRMQSPLRLKDKLTFAVYR